MSTEEDGKLENLQNLHHIVVEFGDGVYMTRLIHPDICAKEDKSYMYSPDDADACWVQSWFDNSTIEEIVYGSLEIPVLPVWTQDNNCELHIITTKTT